MTDTSTVTCLYARTDRALPDDVRARIEGLLPTDERERIGRYRLEADRRARWWGMALVDTGLAQNGASLATLRRDRFNRPAVSAGLDVNLSHSGDYVMVAFRRDGRIGVDIEKVAPVPLDDFESQFSPDEWRRIERAPDRLRRFYRDWTAKEAVVKGDGRGLTLPLAKVAVDDNRGSIDTVEWKISRIALDPDYEACVATDGPPVIVEPPRRIDFT